MARKGTSEKGSGALILDPKLKRKQAKTAVGLNTAMGTYGGFIMGGPPGAGAGALTGAAIGGATAGGLDRNTRRYKKGKLTLKEGKDKNEALIGLSIPGSIVGGGYAGYKYTQHKRSNPKTNEVFEKSREVFDEEWLDMATEDEIVGKPRIESKKFSRQGLELTKVQDAQISRHRIRADAGLPDFPSSQNILEQMQEMFSPENYKEIETSRRYVDIYEPPKLAKGGKLVEKTTDVAMSAEGLPITKHGVRVGRGKAGAVVGAATVATVGSAAVARHFMQSKTEHQENKYKPFYYRTQNNKRTRVKNTKRKK